MAETKHIHTEIPVHTGPFDLSRPHIVGIGGQGTSALAQVLIQRGTPVTGSDARATAYTEALSAAGCTVREGFAAEQITGASVVVWGTAMDTDNPELVAARAAGIPVMHRSDVLAHLMDRAATSVAVAGTHGKSTTTGMLATAVSSLSPSWVGGGSLIGGVNGHHGEGGVFIAEADESDRTLSRYRPDIAIVLNIEDDHPETHVDLNDAIDTFHTLAASTRTLVISHDDPGAQALAERVRTLPELRVVSFGEADDADVRIVSIVRSGAGHTVTVHEADGTETELVVSVPGRHNVLNAVAAFAAGRLLGVAADELADQLGRFAGIERRLSLTGARNGITVRDSFAHHPTAISADITAARSLADGRVIVVFEPCGWTRTMAFGPRMGKALAAADHVVLLAVHSYVAEPIPEVTPNLIADAITGHGGSVDSTVIEDAAELVGALVKPGDLVMTMGTGAVTALGETILTQSEIPAVA